MCKVYKRLAREESGAETVILIMSIRLGGIIPSILGVKSSLRFESLP